jgi:hypothetical protein
VISDPSDDWVQDRLALRVQEPALGGRGESPPAYKSSPSKRNRDK